MGQGGDQVVSVLAFYSDDLSLDPAEAYSFFCKNCVWKRPKVYKKGRGWPIKDKDWDRFRWNKIKLNRLSEVFTKKERDEIDWRTEEKVTLLIDKDCDQLISRCPGVSWLVCDKAMAC